MGRFRDRSDAGRQLGSALLGQVEGDRTIVLALPRGGVPVGYEVARILRAPLDVFVVRKLGVPGHRELAMGALATGNVVVLNHEVVSELQIPRSTIDAVIAAEQQELVRREGKYRGDREPLDVKGSRVILVDDGLATGSTMRAAVAGLRKRRPRRLLIAVPVAAPSTCDELGELVEDIVCLQTPEPMFAVGVWYEDFSQTTDDDVRRLLAQADRELDLRAGLV